MSYSRWSYSCWYTYEDVEKINGERTLTLCDHWSLPVSEIVNRREEILNDLRAMKFKRNPLNYKGDGPTPDHFTEEEIQELNDIMDRFLKDRTVEFLESLKKETGPEDPVL